MAKHEKKVGALAQKILDALDETLRGDVITYTYRRKTPDIKAKPLSCDNPTLSIKNTTFPKA